MSGRTHALVPAAAAVWLFGLDYTLFLTAAAAGLAPDIDEPESVIGRRLWVLALVFKYTVGHRTLSHSILGVLIGVGVALVAGVRVGIVSAVGLGWGLHLVLDALSGGVPLWWPQSHRWVLGRCTVYGVVDMLLLLLAVTVFFAGVAIQFPGWWAAVQGTHALWYGAG